MRRLLALLSIPPLVLVGAYTTWAFWNVRSLAREAERVEAALGSVAGGGEFEARGPGERETALALEQLFGRLEELAPAERALLRPHTWEAPVYGLDEPLAVVAPFFAELDRMLAQDTVRDALAKGGAGAGAVVTLGEMHNAASVVCADALAAARQGRWDAARRRIGHVFDLAWLVDDSTSVGAACRAGFEMTGYNALRRLIAIDGFDARAMREELEPRLERAADPDRPRRTLAVEIDAWAAGADLPCGARDPWAWWTDPWRIRDLRETLSYLALLAETSAAIGRGETVGPEGRAVLEIGSANQLGPAIGARMALQLTLQAQSRHGLARTALALLEHEERQLAWPSSLASLGDLFPRGLPRDPLGGGPYAYAAGGSSATLGPTRIGELQCTGPQQLRGSYQLWSFERDS